MKSLPSVVNPHPPGEERRLAGELLDWAGNVKCGNYGWIAPTYNVAERGIEAFRSVEDIFRQEYMAEFLENSAGVFRGIDGCLDRESFTTKCTKDTKVRDVVIGCDVAKHTDFTVLIAMDERTGDCHAIERFNHLDWPVQKDRILSFVRRYRGRLIMDATGVGDPIYDDLKRVYNDVEGFKLTSSRLLQNPFIYDSG